MNALDDSPTLRAEVIAACRALSTAGHFIGTWGNIAVRLRDGILVTPTRLDYDIMQPDDLVAVDSNGKRIRGERLPTSELQLHRLVLQTREDLDVCLHSHAPACSAVAAAQRSLPVVLEDMAQIIGGEVACSAYVHGGDHFELARAAVAALGRTSRAALLANHGVIVCGNSPNEALVAAMVLEKAAGAMIAASGLGRVTTLPPEAISVEHDRYLHRYGTAADAEVPPG